VDCVFLKNWDLVCVSFLFFIFDRSAPSFPPCDRLQLRCAIPDPSRPGAISPVSASGGSWSALGPWGWLLGKVISTS
jgi:hypothetical protein